MGLLHRPVHSGRLERWLGAAEVDRVSRAARDWYGPPIAVAGVPGRVYANAGGDFSGDLRCGFEATAYDRARDILHRVRRAHRRSVRNSYATLNAGFSSLGDLISEATVGGKRREFAFIKAGTTGVVNVTNSLWAVGSQPAAGAAGSAAPGGRAPTDATTGAFPFTNPTGGDTQHLTAAIAIASVDAQTLLLYDRIFDVAKTMNSSATESVTGVPSRYQSVTSTDPDYAGGNFLFVEVATALAATAHNWTTCLYTDQDGNGSATLPSLTGNSSAIVNRLDHPAGQWFAPLATGDFGIKELDQMQCSATVATGAINFVIGHPIAFFPCTLANLACQYDGISTAFNLVRVYDDACLAFLEVLKSATTATAWSGNFSTVAG